MKNKLIILLLLFMSWHLKAQDYIPLLDTTNKWYMAELTEFGNFYVYVYELGDTVNYFGRTYYHIVGTWKSSEKKEFGDLSEDTIERKVYRPDNDETPIIVYDFSLEEGDSIFSTEENTWFYLDSVRITTIYSIERRIYYFSDEWNDEGTVWIEGIGSIAGLLEPWKYPNLYWWGYPELLCMEQNEEFIYKSPTGQNYGCHLEYLDIENISTKKNLVSINPNPTSGIFTINFTNSPFEGGMGDVNLSITDITGKHIFNSQISNLKTEINITKQAAGIYFLTIQYRSNNQLYSITKKILKY